MYKARPYHIRHNEPRRPGFWGDVERNAGKILLFTWLIGVPLRLVGNSLDIYSMYLLADLMFFVSLVLFITGLILRRKTRRLARRQQASETASRETVSSS